MSLPLQTVRRIAAEVAKDHDPNLEVAVARGKGNSGYTELILTLRGCAVEPCRVVVGVDRRGSEQQVRTAIDEHIRTHLDSHKRSFDG